MKAKRARKPAEPATPEQPSTGSVIEGDGHSPFPVVGIGASAGGLEAFRQLLASLPCDTGMAFVLVQHLAPQHDSHLANLLSQATTLPVVEASDGLAVRADHVYIIPPNHKLAFAHGRLHLTPRGEARGLHLPVDHLFRSLAVNQQARAIGVVLSGTGSDGTTGLREIKAVGGITFAQDDKSAAHPGMPSSAVGSGCVDFVLPPDEIAQRLGQIGAHPYLASERATDSREQKKSDEHFRRVLAVVRAVMGVDFTLYRDTTIRRRIMRRMALHGQHSLVEYAKLLEGERSEVEALYHDLLINVTSFFRDPELFEVLKSLVFPALVDGKAPGEPLRVWVPGCSTGQEPYSLAMALLEFHDARSVAPAIQIFATDLSDQTALDKARAGIYPESIEGEVSPERLRRFFKKDEHVYRIDKSIRDMCVFARHNVAADPPFSHLDLISCRNVLIYLATALQKRVLPTFHYALDVPGFLVLGSAESVGDHGELFELVERAHKIYAKRAVTRRPQVHFATGNPRGSSNDGRRRQVAGSLTPVDFQKEADRMLLGRYAPPAVLVNQALDIVQFRGRTSPYLESPPGEPTSNVLKMAREGLFLELRSALAEVKKRKQPVKRPGVRVTADESGREITLEILPVKPAGGSAECLLIVFHEAGGPAASAPPTGRSSPAPALLPSAGEGTRAGRASQRELRHLRQELAATKEYLQSLAEKQDAANEDLRSANEEVLSSNEELQSTNEELETAKEELQSANEELTTVNEQLQHRNAELSLLNNDLTNLLSSANIPIVIVGPNLRIRRFTPPASRAMSLLPTDIGRPIGDIRAVPDLADLEAIIGGVMDSVQTVEREIRDGDGRWCTLRVSPYRTSDNKIDGAVIVLMDIDEIRRTRDELQRQSAQLQLQASLIEMSHDAIIVRDSANLIVLWNHGAAEIYGFSEAEVRGRVLDSLVLTDPAPRAALNQALETTGFWEGELRQVRRDGSEIVVHSRETLLRNPTGEGSAVLSINRDVTESKRVLLALKHADRLKDQFLATLAHELRNPIAPIRNVVEILRLGADDPETVRQVREVLDRQVGQLTFLIEDLIDVSRIVEKKVELHIERVTVDSVVGTALETCRSLLESAGHQLSVTVPEKLYLDVDPMRMSQVLVNLLNNAAKYTPRGGRIWLTVEALRHVGGLERGRPGRPDAGSQRVSQVVIRVRDNGVGIAPDLQARVFEMFEQGTSPPQHGCVGLGVGLSLVRSLATMHGGTVDVHSEGSGRGAEFILRLPAANPTLSSTGEPEVPPPPSSLGPPPHRRVLVVDDNPDVVTSLGKLLEMLGHEVCLAHDGVEALGRAAIFLPDVALLDLSMPGLSGFEVAARMRADPQLCDTLLVAQTGLGQERDRLQSLEAGFDYHLVKPLDVSQLRGILALTRNESLRGK